MPKATRKNTVLYLSNLWFIMAWRPELVCIVILP